MAWTAFSFEAVELDGKIRKLHAEGRTSAALDLIKVALDKAHREGPSNTSYEEAEAIWAGRYAEQA